MKPRVAAKHGEVYDSSVVRPCVDYIYAQRQVGRRLLQSVKLNINIAATSQQHHRYQHQQAAAVVVRRLCRKERKVNEADLYSAFIEVPVTFRRHYCFLIVCLHM